MKPSRASPRFIAAHRVCACLVVLLSLPTRSNGSLYPPPPLGPNAAPCSGPGGMVITGFAYYPPELGGVVADYNVVCLSMNSTNTLSYAPCADAESQKFAFANGKLMNVATGLCVDDAASPIQLVLCQGASAFTWSAQGLFIFARSALCISFSYQVNAFVLQVCDASLVTQQFHTTCLPFMSPPPAAQPPAPPIFSLSPPSPPPLPPPPRPPPPRPPPPSPPAPPAPPPSAWTRTSFACSNVYRWYQPPGAAGGVMPDMGSTKGEAAAYTGVISAGALWFSQNTNAVTIPSVWFGATDLTIFITINPALCAPGAALLDSAAMRVEFVDAACNLNISFSGYSYATKNLQLAKHTWQLLTLTLKQSGQVLVGVGVFGAANYVTFESRVSYAQTWAADAQGAPALRGPSAPTPQPVVLGGSSFRGAIADVQLYLSDVSTNANRVFSFNTTGACPTVATDVPGLYVRLGLRFNDSSPLLGTLADAQLYNTSIGAATAASLLANAAPAGCAFSSPPPSPPPPSPSPPPPSPSPPPNLNKSPPPPSPPPASPPPPSPPPRSAPPAQLTASTRITISGCVADSSLIQPCGNYSRFSQAGSILCPYTNLQGSIADAPSGAVLFSNDDGYAVYQSGFIKNPFDNSGLSDFRFWLYVSKETNFTAIIGTLPCAPSVHVFPMTNIATARYLSTSYDVEPRAERFQTWKSISPFGLQSFTTLRITLIS